MNPMPLLLALLVLAYLGSMWVSARGGRSFGSPSGVEYVVLGALLGPHALGVLGDAALTSFEPIAHVALGWLALGFGLECGVLGDRVASPSRILLGSAFAAVTASLSALGVGFAASRLGYAYGDALILLSAALGLVCAETTRHALRWVSDRHIASGPLSTLVAELAAADDAFVMVALAVLFAVGVGPLEVVGVPLAPWTSALLTLAVGVGLGLACAWAIASSPRKVEWWTVLLGGTWLAIGMCTKLGLSAMGATFALGLTLSSASREAGTLREMFAHTEGPVLLPALLLAGARIALPSSMSEGILVAVAVWGRALSSVLTGTAIAVARASTRPAAGWLGLGMLSSGTLTMTVGFALSLRFSGQLGRIALLVAAVGTLLGELLGPFALRRALRNVGELGGKRDSAPEPEPESPPREVA